MVSCLSCEAVEAEPYENRMDGLSPKFCECSQVVVSCVMFVTPSVTQWSLPRSLRQVSMCRAGSRFEVFRGQRLQAQKSSCMCSERPCADVSKGFPPWQMTLKIFEVRAHLQVRFSLSSLRGIFEILASGAAMPGRVLCCLSAVAVAPSLRPATEVHTEGKQDASGWEVQEGFKAERISSEEKGSEMEEASAEEEEETVDELLRKMAEQPADAALQLRGLEAMQGGSWDPHLAAAAIVAAMQAHPQDRALQLEACRAALDHIFEKEEEAEIMQRAVSLMEHGLIAPVRVAIQEQSDDHRLFDAAVEVLFRMYQSAIQRNSYIASEALLRDEDAAIVALLVARLQGLAEAPEPLAAAASAETIALLLSCYGAGGPEAKRAVAAAGPVPKLLSCLEVLQESEGFQEWGCLLLNNLAGGPPEVKEELLRAGAVGGLGAALQRALAVEGSGSVRRFCCAALGSLGSGISEDLRHKLQDPDAIDAVCRVLREDRSDRATRSPAVAYLLHLAELPAARPILEEAQAVEALLLTGVRHDEVFGPAATVLAYFPADRVSQKVELTKVPCEECQPLLEAAASRRVTTLGLVKDTVLPLADVILDVLNFIDLVKRRYFLWMACLLCGLIFNGIASATLQQARPGRAMLNFFTFGTSGQVAEGLESYAKGVKTETLLRQKMVEGLESVLSLLVTADALAVAGNLADVPELSPASAGLKWASVGLSVACLSLLAHDLDKKAIHECEDLSHLRRMSSFRILAFHISEVLAALVVVLFASATRPWGLPCLAGAVALSTLVLHFRSFQSLEGNWIVTTDGLDKGDKVCIAGEHVFLAGQDWALDLKAGGMSALVQTDTTSFSASFEDACDLMIWSAGSYASGANSFIGWAEMRFCRQETALLHEAGWIGLGRGAGLARCLVSFLIYVPFTLVLNVTTFLSPSLLRQLALLRLAAFLAAWMAVVYQAHFSPDFVEEIVTPHNIALCSLAAVGLLLHLVLLREQVQAGRFSHARLQERPNSGEGEARSLLASEGQP